MVRSRLVRLLLLLYQLLLSDGCGQFLGRRLLLLLLVMMQVVVVVVMVVVVMMVQRW